MPASFGSSSGATARLRTLGRTMASVSPSASTLSASTVIRMSRPGKSVAHQPPARSRFLPLEITLPQDGAGSCTPAPMKERLASKTMASATRIVAKTRMGAAQLRKTCLSRMYAVFAPSTRSAAT